MNKLLQLTADYHWDLTGIEFAIKERVGEPADFIGRVEEMQFLYDWAGRIPRGISKSIAFLGRRKVGKSLMLERLYNILYSEHKGLIPFYYEFTEGCRNGKEFYRDFVTRFYMQVIGYYTHDTTWIRQAVNKDIEVDAATLLHTVEPLTFTNHDIVVARLANSVRILQTDRPLYEYVLAAGGAPHGFATTIGVEDQVVQMVDEFQYLNMYIDAGVVDKPCMAYMSTAESRVAPLLITGSLMGVVTEELMRWLPQRFSTNIVPKMKAPEAQAMTLSYGSAYGYPLTPELATYIVYITNGVPGRIVELLTPKIGKPALDSFTAIDQALEFEVSIQGGIKHDWDEYLALAMDAVNDVNMRRITYFLCKHEGTWFSPRELKQALALDVEDRQLRQELGLLYKYDIIAMSGDRYGGVFDRTLKKVLMKNYPQLFNLPLADFDAYFRADNLLDYLQERVAYLELSLAEAEILRQQLHALRGAHNNLQGHYYEREILLALIQHIIDGKGSLVAGIAVTAFTPTLNYHLTDGTEIDIVLAGETVVVMIECKHYAPRQLHKITPAMVDDFVAKASRLHRERFPHHELRLGLFSKHGLEPALAHYATAQDIHLSLTAQAQ